MKSLLQKVLYRRQSWRGSTPTCSCTQERWGSKTHHQLKSPEPVHAPPTLQGWPETERSSEARGLASNDRSKRCIPDYPHGPGPSEILEVRQMLPIQLPPIWPSLCTMGVHQDPQASTREMGVRLIAYNYRQHTNPGRDQGASPGSRGGTDLNVWASSSTMSSR